MKIENRISANTSCMTKACIPSYMVMALSGFIPQDYLGAFFSIISGIFLLVLMLFWQKSTFLQVVPLESSSTITQNFKENGNESE